MIAPAEILIVDDDADIRETLSQVLEDEGYAVTAVGNGSEALRYLQSASVLPGLILLDMMMPVMSGEQFQREKGKLAEMASIPVVVISAQAGHDPMTLGAREVISKPLSLDSLLGAVARTAPPRILA